MGDVEGAVDVETVGLHLSFFTQEIYAERASFKES
jgi:hypothetical protein